MPRKRFVILSGPSCVGKGPLFAAINRFHPDAKYAQIPVIKSKESRPTGPRPEEVNVWNNPDFFQFKKDILKLKGNHQYLVGDCRGMPQAVDLNKVQQAEAELLFIEIYHTIGVQLADSTFLKEVETTTVFLSPISRQEIEDLKSAGVNLDDYLTQIMLHKQLVRARYQGKYIDDSFVKDAFGRARDTISELVSGCKYSHVIVNHDGEGNPNWNRLPGGAFTRMPEGDAGRAVSALLQVLVKPDAAEVENWKSLGL